MDLVCTNIRVYSDNNLIVVEERLPIPQVNKQAIIESASFEVKKMKKACSVIHEHHVEDGEEAISVFSTSTDKSLSFGDIAGLCAATHQVHTALLNNAVSKAVMKNIAKDLEYLAHETQDKDN